MRRAGILACALALALALAGPAGAQPISGVIKQVDAANRTIVLDDGRAVKFDDKAVVLVNNRPADLSALRPGMLVVVEPAAPPVRTTVTPPPPARPSAPPASVAAIESPGGTVASVDPTTQTIVLSDGRVIQTDADTVVIVNDRPVRVSAVAPGDTVVVRRGEASASPGRYVPWPPNVPESEIMLEPQAP